MTLPKILLQEGIKKQPPPPKTQRPFALSEKQRKIERLKKQKDKLHQVPYLKVHLFIQEST